MRMRLLEPATSNCSRPPPAFTSRTISPADGSAQLEFSGRTLFAFEIVGWSSPASAGTIGATSTEARCDYRCLPVLLPAQVLPTAMKHHSVHGFRWFTISEATSPRRFPATAHFARQL